MAAPAKAGICAQRLSIARRKRGLTKKDLASKIGVSRSAVTEYEGGDCRPSDQVLEAVSFATNFPPSFFLAEETEQLSDHCISFRARSAMTTRVRDMAMASSDIAHICVVQHLKKHFQLPPLDIPNLKGETPEAAADILRMHWHLGMEPIANLVHLMESKGVFIFWTDIDSPCVDAVSFWWDNQAYALMNIHKSAGDRGRYDGAHELGHFVLHRDKDLIGGEKMEDEANRFAAAFLMPAVQFRHESPRVPVLASYFPLKRRWGCSIQALVRRSRDVGAISQWHYESACKQISVFGWRKSEPVEVAIKREESLLHKKAFEQLADKNISPEQFARESDLFIDDLFELAPQAKTVHDLRYRENAVAVQEVVHGHLRLVTTNNS